MSKQPVHKVELYFPITGAVWKNENSDGRIWYSVTIERRYKAEDGNWYSTASFDAGDLLLLQKVAGIAHSKIYELMKADRDAQQRDPGAEG